MTCEQTIKNSDTNTWLNKNSRIQLIHNILFQTYTKQQINKTAEQTIGRTIKIMVAISWFSTVLKMGVNIYLLNGQTQILR